jgi:hypothetical protein
VEHYDATVVVHDFNTDDFSISSYLDSVSIAAGYPPLFEKENVAVVGLCYDQSRLP